ncbi:MAG: recombination regulator RecX [Gammaproteobacteria bacterium]|nr:recombination regulator RecX [Gammaproteobacteria bacterium]
MTSSEPEAARKLAIKLLSRREHSSKELMDKLARKGHRGPEIAALIAELAADGWQSDRRFAEAFTRERVRRGRGPLRLRSELRERGIDDSLIETVLSQDADWSAVLTQVAVSRFGAEPPSDARESAKRMRFLYNRGFSSAEIHRFFRDAGW